MSINLKGKKCKVFKHTRLNSMEPYEKILDYEGIFLEFGSIVHSGEDGNVATQSIAIIMKNNGEIVTPEPDIYTLEFDLVEKEH